MNTINNINKEKKHERKIYGFIGVIGSGKNYRCQELLDYDSNYVKVDFADALREMMWDILCWYPANDRIYERFKNGYEYIDIMGAFANGRELLQRFGQTMRKHDKNFWVNAWAKKVDKLLSMGYNIVISDIRHENELTALKRFLHRAEVNVIFCDYKSERYDANNNHISEKLAQSYLNNGYIDGDKIEL